MRLFDLAAAAIYAAHIYIGPHRSPMPPRGISTHITPRFRAAPLMRSDELQQLSAAFLPLVAPEDKYQRRIFHFRYKAPPLDSLYAYYISRRISQLCISPFTNMGAPHARHAAEFLPLLFIMAWFSLMMRAWARDAAATRQVRARFTAILAGRAKEATPRRAQAGRGRA